MFSDPKTLPCHRHIDHVINLVPGAVPINSRPSESVSLRRSSTDFRATEKSYD